MTRFRSRMLSAGLIALAVAGCTPSAQPPAQDSQDQAAVTVSQSELDSLRTVIREAVAEPVCDDVSQCRAIAFGAKPCGGPWTYLVYSVAVTDSAALAELVERYNREEDALNRAEERISDCALVTRPGLICVEGVCAARQR